MRKYVTILVMLLCVGFVSCSDDSNDIPAFKIAGNEMDITAVGGTVVVTLSMEGEKATSDQSWCVPSVSEKTVKLTLEKNTALEGRTALITVTKGEESISFPVTQPGNLVPTITTEGVEFDAHGGELEVPVRNALPFSVVVKDDASWLKANVNGSTLVIEKEKNYTRSQLKTTVKLISEELESEFVVQQSGLVLTPEKSSLVMYNKGDEATIMVNSTLDFEASSDQDWLTITPGEDFITLTAADNSGEPARTASVTLTSMGLTSTINVTQRPTIYSDYLGGWTLTGNNNGTPFSYNLTIAESVKGSTYKVNGWGKSILATGGQYPLAAVFDAETQYIYITQQTNLGVFSDEGGDYTVGFRGLIEYGGGLSFVGGSFICYMGEMQRDGSVQWANGIINVGGQRYQLVGSFYCIESHEDGEIYNFNADVPYMFAPTMKRSSSVSYSTFTRGINSSKKVKGFAVSNLQAQD